MTLRRVVFSSCFYFGNFEVISAQYTRTPTKATSESEHDKKRAAREAKRKATTRLTLEVLRQLGIALA
jgi:hypothetical protein